MTTFKKFIACAAVSMIPALVQAQVPIEEREALIAFYNATGGDNWTNNTGWLGEPGTECNWFGITCSEVGVTAISFPSSGNNLVGTLPVELGDLSELQTLSLQANKLTGQLPSSIGNLTNLRNLNLVDNQLSGEIPEQLWSLTSLRELFIRLNNFSGALSDNVRNLQQLTHLHLDSAGPLPEGLWTLANLTELTLVQRQQSVSLPAAISNLSKLVRLDIRGEFVGLLPEQIGSLRNLWLLSLRGNKFEGTIPSSIGTLSELAYLDLSNNRFDGEIPVTFLALQKLERLYLSDNQLTGSIPDGLSALPLLTTLTLSNNPGLLIPLADPAEREALIAFYHATGGDNWLNNTGWLGEPGTECSWYGISCRDGRVSRISFPATMINNVLTGNNLSGNLPAELGLLTGLTELSLDANNLQGGIPAEIWQLANLQRLVLLRNPGLGGSLPAEIGDLSELTVLLLSDTGLTGAIPQEIGNLTKLTTLWLSLNNLTGDLPDQIWDLKEMSYLDLGDNELTGVIPAKVGELSNMKYLLLRNNQLSGSIPEQLLLLTNLEELALENNRLTGAIPAGLAQMPSLIKFSVANNPGLLIPLADPAERDALIAFYHATGGDNWLNKEGWLGAEGTECSWFGITCTNQQVIRLYMFTGLSTDDNGITTILGNNLVGQLPSEIGFLKNLRILSLPSNSGLTGAIPAEIGQLKQLQILSLTANNLTGPIPEQIGELSELISLNLMRNALDGSIPAELAQLQKLTGLFLAQNRISGPIPPEIGQLSSLGALNLGFNQLSGALPDELLSLTNLTTLHLQNNQFSGYLPAGLDALPLLTSFDASGNRFGSERAALLDFYAATNGDGWLNKQGWLGAEGTECTWYGVVCVDGTIRSLALPSNALQGVLPGTLNELRELSSLVLPNNHISGPLPTLSGSVTVNVDYNPADSVNAAQIVSLGEHSGVLFSGIGNKLSFYYSATSLDPNLTGLGLRIHYSTSQISAAELLDILPTGFIAADVQPRMDSNNFDNDPTTDRYLTVAWADFSGQWPGVIPRKLFDLELTLASSVADGTAIRIGFSVLDNARGYGVRLPLVRMSSVNGLLDIDGDGKAEALSDGLLVVRGLFGFSDEALTRGAISNGARYTTTLEVLERLSLLAPVMDIDDDGRLDALTDGLLLIRYLFGFRDDVLIRGAIGTGATRASPQLIEQYLHGVTGL